MFTLLSSSSSFVFPTITMSFFHPSEIDSAIVVWPGLAFKRSDAKPYSRNLRESGSPQPVPSLTPMITDGVVA